MSSWLYLFKNKRQLVKWLVATMLPILFVVGFLSVTNHTSQQVNQLRVAVVNLDKGARYRDKKRHIGDDFSRTLHQAKSFKTINYATQKQAESALRHGNVSAVVVMPINFTSQLASAQKSGKSVSIKQLIASGQSQFASQYIQRELISTLNRENTLLSVGMANSSVLKNLTNQSQNLSKQANDLQVNLQAVGNGINEQTTNDLQEKANDEATKLATYSAQLNDAVNAGDTTKIQELAVAINDVSYAMQTTVVGGISNISANLSQTKALSDRTGVIQSSAKDIQNGQSRIASQLKNMLGEQTANQNISPLSQILSFDMTDIQPIKQGGQTILPNILVVGVTMLAMLFGLMLPLKPAKKEALALEQWWGTFQIAGVLNILAIMLMLFGTMVLNISIGNYWSVTGVTLLASLAMMSIVWYLKQVMGQTGWWLALAVMLLQAIFTITTTPIAMSTGILKFVHNILPLTALNNAIKRLVFGGNVQQEVMILILWLLVFVILLVTYYRVQQRQILKNELSES